MDKSTNGKKGGKMRSAPASLLPVCLLKLFFHFTNALGVEKSVQHSGSCLCLSAPELCYVQSHGTKADSKKDKVRDGNPSSIHYAQPVDRGGASLQFKDSLQTLCE